jgi:hypothetical protein
LLEGARGINRKDEIALKLAKRKIKLAI